MIFMKIKHLFGMAGVAGAAALGCAAYSELAIRTTEYSLETGKTDCPLTVTVLSDLHFSVFGKDNCRLVKAVKETNPDAILLAGDFFDYHHERTNTDIVVKTLKALCGIAPVYMTPGNHDKRYDIQAGEDYRKHAENAGVTVLDSEIADVEIMFGIYTKNGGALK